MPKRERQDPPRVLLVGLGVVGRRIARALAARGVPVAGAADVDPARTGRSLPELGGRDVPVLRDLATLVAEVPADVVLHATRYDPAAIVREIAPVLRAGLDVVSVSGISQLRAVHEPLAEVLDRTAREGGATVLGTGLNPGFLQDLLPIVLTGACDAVRAVTATRVTDFAPWGPAVMQHYGIGLSEADFRRAVEGRRIGLHAEIRQSLAMVAGALGWRLAEVAEERAPLVTKRERATAHVRIPAGAVCGFRHRAVGAGAEGRIALELVGIVGPDPAEDGVQPGTEIAIEGTPDVLCRIDGLGTAEGVYAGTAARAVNAIPHAIAAEPGLYSVADLPVMACWGAAASSSQEARHG
jgi:4-hydroxy-tetrahydrodipicolinate reductase